MKRSIVLAFGLFFILFQSQVQAQLAYEIQGNGTQQTVPLDASHITNNTLQFYFVSRGNVSNSIYFEVSGPDGLTATVESALLRLTIPRVLENQKLWYPVRLSKRLNLAGNARQGTVIDRSSVAQRCPWLTDEVYNQVLALYIAMGLNPSKEEICDMYSEIDNGGGGGSGGGSSGGGQSYQGSLSSASAYGLLLKNTCGGKKSRYLVRMKVDLSAVNQDVLRAGSQVVVSAKQAPYRGSTATLLKPESEGRFSPSPIVLMASVGSYGASKERMTLWRWKRNKMVQMKKLRKGGYVSYRGDSYVNSVVSNVLVGGKGTFVLSNGTSAYSVCLKLERRRQTLNRFPAIR